MNELTKFFKGMTQNNVTQVFHKDHQALDIVGAYGTPLCAPENCLILGITKEELVENNQALENGYGVRMKGLETGHEYLYWHTLPILPVWGGDSVRRGQIVAYMGNAGNVRVDGKYVPLEDRILPNHPGTHLHIEMFKDGVRIDPLPHINWSWEPQWTKTDFISSFLKVLSKMAKL